MCVGGRGILLCLRFITEQKLLITLILISCPPLSPPPPPLYCLPDEWLWSAKYPLLTLNCENNAHVVVLTFPTLPHLNRPGCGFHSFQGKTHSGERGPCVHQTDVEMAGNQSRSVVSLHGCIEPSRTTGTFNLKTNTGWIPNGKKENSTLKTKRAFSRSVMIWNTPEVF